MIIFYCVRLEPYIGVCACVDLFAGRAVTLEALFRERLILREPGSGTRNILERELARVGYSVWRRSAGGSCSSQQLQGHFRELVVGRATA
ncbi:MAG: hypothetical protein V8T29_00035 [Oscillospiraceae bacterium]